MLDVDKVDELKNKTKQDKKTSEHQCLLPEIPLRHDNPQTLL